MVDRYGSILKLSESFKAAKKQMESSMSNSEPTPAGNPRQTLSLREVADRIGVSYSTVKRDVYARRLGSYLIRGRRRVSEQQVSDWLRRCEVGVRRGRGSSSVGVNK